MLPHARADRKLLPLGKTVHGRETRAYSKAAATGRFKQSPGRLPPAPRLARHNRPPRPMCATLSPATTFLSNEWSRTLY